MALVQKGVTEIGVKKEPASTAVVPSPLKDRPLEAAHPTSCNGLRFDKAVRIYDNLTLIGRQKTVKNLFSDADTYGNCGIRIADFSKIPESHVKVRGALETMLKLELSIKKNEVERVAGRSITYGELYFVPIDGSEDEGAYVFLGKFHDRIFNTVARSNGFGPMFQHETDREIAIVVCTSESVYDRMMQELKNETQPHKVTWV